MVTKSSAISRMNFGTKAKHFRAQIFSETLDFRFELTSLITEERFVSSSGRKVFRVNDKSKRKFP
jgi:hypothetical protein